MPIFQPQCTSFSSLWVPGTTCVVETCSVIGNFLANLHPLSSSLKPLYFPMCTVLFLLSLSSAALSQRFTQSGEAGWRVGMRLCVCLQKLTFAYHFVFRYSFLLVLLLWLLCSSSLSSSELSVAKLIRCRRSDTWF